LNSFLGFYSFFQQMLDVAIDSWIIHYDRFY